MALRVTWPEAHGDRQQRAQESNDPQCAYIHKISRRVRAYPSTAACEVSMAPPEVITAKTPGYGHLSLWG
jgi:hypothetical protein